MKITVLQWNVWLYEKKEHLLELISEYKPDIICMQELTTGSPFQGNADVIEYLADALSYQQFHKFIPNGTPDGIGAWGTGIMTRLPLLSTHWEWTQEPKRRGSEFQKQYRLYLEAEVAVGNSKLSIGTTQMSYTDRFEDTDERKPEADAVVEIAGRRKQRYILAADLNSVPESYVVGRLSSLLQHTGPAFDANTWTTKTHDYRGFRETRLNWRLDYVFTTDDIEVVSAEVIKTGYSDHLPILVTLTV